MRNEALGKGLSVLSRIDLERRQGDAPEFCLGGFYEHRGLCQGLTKEHFVTFVNHQMDGVHYGEQEAAQGQVPGEREAAVMEMQIQGVGLCFPSNEKLHQIYWRVN